jgi:hypothetical protein
MSYKKRNSAAILVAISVIALALVTTASFSHSYTVFAAPKKNGSKGSDSSTGNNNGVTTLGGNPSSSSSSSAAATPNSNALTKKELSSFIDCIRTANGSQGLTHKVVTNCLDTAKSTTAGTTGGVISSATGRGGDNAAGSRSFGGSSGPG